MNLKFILGVSIFVLTFYHIVKDKYPKAFVAMLGGSLMVFTRVLDEHTALKSVGTNLEVLFLLMGLMLIVDIMAESGVFQWFAIKVAQMAKGDPIKILIALSLITGIGSAFLDNVTTVLLIVPVAILLAKQLKLDPFPFIMMQIFAANIGGAATLIGDPPNLVIGAAAKLGFNDFLVNVAPLAIVNMIVLMITCYFVCRKRMVVSNELRAVVMDLDAERAIKDRKLMKSSLILFSIVLIGFLTNSFTHYGLAIIALLGAVVLMLWTKQDPEHMFKKIEWDTLFFFGGLFVLVDGIDALGIMTKMADFLLSLTQGHKFITAQLILFLSTLLSPVLGSVPFTLSFIKIVQQIVPTFQGDVTSFWWALSIGACLGGNMTLIGSACNLVAISISKKAGIEITFKTYLKYGLLVVLQSFILSAVYLWFIFVQ